MPTRFLFARSTVVTLVTMAALTVVSGDAAAQATASTVCKDGTTTTASGRGACSGHGGVDRSATKSAHQAVPRASTAAQVTCNDGTTSKSGRGACSHHGGISNGAPVPPAVPRSRATQSPSLPASVPAESPARTRSQAKSQAPSAVGSGGGEDNDPTGAIAQCKDGMYSHAKHRRGACSRHGGVAKWMAA